MLPQHRGCHVLPCMSWNTGQINPAGFQSLKCMYYIHVIMIIKWFWLRLWLWFSIWNTSYYLQLWLYQHTRYMLESYHANMLVKIAFRGCLPSSLWIRQFTQKWCEDAMSHNVKRCQLLVGGGRIAFFYWNHKRLYTKIRAYEYTDNKHTW